MKLLRHFEQALAGADGAAPGPRLADDARRLWARVERLLGMRLIDVPAGGHERGTLELACYALQLPLRRGDSHPPERRGRLTFRERCEDAAEALIVEAGIIRAGPEVDGTVEDGTTEDGTIEAGRVKAGTWSDDDALLAHATRTLREAPHRPPMLDEAKVLADAVNLEDFGLTGLVQHVLQLGREGQGVMQLAEGLLKREQYGYWDARLKDGFHFEPVRHLAQRRLDHARQAAGLLRAELAEDAGVTVRADGRA